MFLLWLIVAVVLFGGGMYWFGTLESAPHVKDSVFWIIVFVCAAWPLILGAAILGAPFLGLYALGARKRKKKQANDSN